MTMIEDEFPPTSGGTLGVIARVMAAVVALGDLVTTNEHLLVGGYLGQFPRTHRDYGPEVSPFEQRIPRSSIGLVVSDAVGSIRDLALVLIDGRIVAVWVSALDVVSSVG